MRLEKEVFKAYDVRGPVPEAFDAEGAGRIALALVKYLQEEGAGEHPTLVLARDARPSSAPIEEQVIKNLVAAGVGVQLLGLSTTPMFYFAVNHLKADGGIMITASHNPPPDNGLKMVRKKAIAIGAGAGMEDIKAIALSERSLVAEGAGFVEESDVLEEYIEFLLTFADVQKPLSVVIDTGNGMSPVVLEELLPKLTQVEVDRLYFDIDLTFPNHEANPLKEETLKDLKSQVLVKGADLGVAFDGDGDRVGFVTHEGNVVRGDFITALLAKDALARANKPEEVLYEVKSSRVVAEQVRASGGIPVRVATGHAEFNHKLREGGGILGGELSCHYYFRETFNRDGPMLAMLRIFSMIANGTSLASAIAPYLSRYVQSGEINFRIGDKAEVLKRIHSAYPDGEHSTTDGLTVEYPDWWFNVRASNTEDLLRLNVEARDAEQLEDEFFKLRELIGGVQE